MIARFQTGMLSTIESIHFAKPMIGIPMYFDQESNMNMAEYRGYGISLPYRELTTEKLQIAVRKIITHPRFKLNIYAFSKFQYKYNIFFS